MGGSSARAAACSTRAKSTSTGWVNSSRSATSTASTCRTREMTCTASSECPPSSKKLSWRPTRSAPSTSAQTSASACSVSPTGGLVLAGGVRVPFRRRQRLAVQLAVGRKRPLLQPHVRRGHHVRRQRLAQVCPQHVRAGRLAAHHVRHQARVSRRVLARQHHRLAHVRVLRQPRLDLAQLDAEAADLHLVVRPAQVLQAPVRQPPPQVAGAVQPRPRLAAEGIGHESLRRQLRTAQVPARHPRARRRTARRPRPRAPAPPPGPGGRRAGPGSARRWGSHPPAPRLARRCGR